jgi:hypothetical protein
MQKEKIFKIDRLYEIKKCLQKTEDSDYIVYCVNISKGCIDSIEF